MYNIISCFGHEFSTICVGWSLQNGLENSAAKSKQTNKQTCIYDVTFYKINWLSINIFFSNGIMNFDSDSNCDSLKMENHLSGYEYNSVMNTSDFNHWFCAIFSISNVDHRFQMRYFVRNAIEIANFTWNKFVVGMLQVSDYLIFYFRWWLSSLYWFFIHSLNHVNPLSATMPYGAAAFFILFCINPYSTYTV